MIAIQDLATQTRHVPGFIDFMATDGRYIWATNQNKLQKFSTQQYEPIAEIEVPQAAGIPVVAFEAVWVASLKDNAIYKIDQKNNVVLNIIYTGLADQTGEFALTASADAIWVASAEGIVSKIDPDTCEVIGEVEVLAFSYNLCYANGALWISNTRDASIQRIDPIQLKVTHRIEVDDCPWFISAHSNFLWSLNQTNGTLSKINTQTCELVCTIQLPALAQGDGGDIFASDNKVWVRTTRLLLIEIDAEHHEIIRQIQHDANTGSGAVMLCDQHIWITAHDIETLWLYPV